MGKRGPAGKPTNLRLLHGDRTDRINTDEPQPDASDVVCPEWLPERAAAVWARLAPDLIRKKVLTAWDVDAFAAFCAAVVISQDAYRDVDEHGEKCVTPVRELADGTLLFELRRNPAWQVARESTQVIATLGGRYGLTPSDRAQLSISEEGDSDPTEDLLTG